MCSKTVFCHSLQQVSQGTCPSCHHTLVTQLSIENTIKLKFTVSSVQFIASLNNTKDGTEGHRNSKRNASHFKNQPANHDQQEDRGSFPLLSENINTYIGINAKNSISIPQQHSKPASNQRLPSTTQLITSHVEYLQSLRFFKKFKHSGISILRQWSSNSFRRTKVKLEIILCQTACTIYIHGNSTQIRTKCAFLKYTLHVSKCVCMCIWYVKRKKHDIMISELCIRQNAMKQCNFLYKYLTAVSISTDSHWFVVVWGHFGILNHHNFWASRFLSNYTKS